jgi:hypothetical protein
MSPILPPLVDGERLTREEFLRRWDALPELKFAELIEGVVYLPSPLTRSHGSHDALVQAWAVHYEAETPGAETGANATWLMLSDAPQPDCCLCIAPEYGGRAGEVRGLGAPELIVEVTRSTRARDFGPKLRLYRAAGVLEYITVVLQKPHVAWRQLVEGDYVTLAPDPDGLLRSRVFPGLWLDPAALLRRDARRVLDVLKQGLASPEHRRFVEELASRAGSQ